MGVELSTVEVRAWAENLEGLAWAGSEGVVAAPRLAALPVLRPGEVLETVPGLIVTQHAGDGKANQYFLRGFNLDHGSDFAISVGGVPVNLPSHAHGQGYSDLNFVIPELVEQVRYRKGPYFAEAGDFASAGQADIDYVRRLDGQLAQISLGRNGYARSLLAGTPALGDGRLLYAFEAFHNDGPWQVAEHYAKLNGVLRYGEGSRNDGWSLTAMAYRATWTSTDQIPERAIDSGRLDRFGTTDPSTGGVTARYSLVGEWARLGESGQTRAKLWWLRDRLDLWSNFQYALNDPVQGDQFKQAERRDAGGFALAHSWPVDWSGHEVINSLGGQGRLDLLQPVGLYATQNRQTLRVLSEDRIRQRSLALWAQNEWRWNGWLRSVAGLRADYYHFNVADRLAENSGQAADHIVTPRFSLIFGPWARSEFYLNLGQGFHSNDARGTTITRDPLSGEALAKVKPLVRTRGQELGLRAEWLPGWRTTLALWQLDSASELLFVGDAGTTEPSRPARRRGLEWNTVYTVNGSLALDADLAWSQARFRDASPAGDLIPGAVTTTANLGLTVDPQGSWFASLRLRYFGPRPLLEDGSVRSAASAVTNLRFGYRVERNLQLALDVYNVFDRRINDIEYWYCSRLPGEAANPGACADGTAGGYDDRHVHPGEPRSWRLTLSYRY